MLSEKHRTQLHSIAKQSIEHGLREGRAIDVDSSAFDTELQQHRASFVTLHINGALRGCIGSLEAQQTLIENVAHNAWAAAFSDHRFSPVTVGDFSQLNIHISILSEPEPITFVSENDLLDKIRPGVDGLVLEDDIHRGTFLPSVWETVPDASSFLNHLKQKAGLPMDHWSNTIKVQRYTVEEF